MVDVSFVLRNKAVRAGAAQWLDELPALVASLEQEWSIRVGRPFADATEAFVAEAVLEDGSPAASKLVCRLPATPPITRSPSCASPTARVAHACCVMTWRAAPARSSGSDDR